jgi:hypothetical protein
MPIALNSSGVRNYHHCRTVANFLNLTLPDALKVPPISQLGNVAEIIGKFGGAARLRNAVNHLQSLLFAA